VLIHVKHGAPVKPNMAHAPFAGVITMSKRTLFTLVAALVGGLALASPARAESRGELLYKTHCIACHSSQKHWRDQKRATDQASLMAQVRQWQAASALHWSEGDILEVTRYLNETFYKFAPASASVSLPGTGEPQR
jgi:mono/diheme cytochrome c family protein